MELLKKLTGKEYIVLVNRGNSAIKSALKALKRLEYDNVFIPDQGGWLTYRQFPSKLGFSVEQIETDSGLIDAESVEDKEGVLLYQSLVGYFAEQDVEEIRREFRGRIILDVCDLGARENWPADILVGSFGKWKVVDAGYGGFIATDDKEIYDMLDVSNYGFDESKLELLKEKLGRAKKRLNYLYSMAEEVKKDLKDFDIVHRDRKGLNVIVRFNNDAEKNKVIEYCDKKGYEYTLCPRYIRVNEGAVSIELKRL